MRGLLYKMGVVAVSLNCFSVLAQGTLTVFDSMSGGVAYDKAGGIRVDDSIPVAGYSFVVGRTVRLFGLEVPIWSDPAGGKALFSIYSMGAGTGMPGALLETMRSDALAYYPPALVSIKARGETVLNGGERYWLVLSTDPGSEVYWQNSSKEISGPFFSRQSGIDLLVDGRIGAFTVQGIAVPEPSCAIIFVMAASLMVMFKRREKQ